MQKKSRVVCGGRGSSVKDYRRKANFVGGWVMAILQKRTFYASLFLFNPFSPHSKISMIISTDS